MIDIRDFDEVSVDRCASIFHALGDASRMSMVVQLLERPTSLNELARQENESLKAVSQRLRILVAAGIVRRSREAKEVVFSIADEEMFRLISAGCTRALRGTERRAEDQMLTSQDQAHQAAPIELQPR